jgi:serine/threonine-protein kinase
MAPEQIHSPRDLTVAVDVYGLGAVLYELLAGRAPAVGETAAEIVASIMDRDPPRPRTLAGAGDVDADLETICLKCLRKAPGERYASAAGVAADLDRYLADEPIAARPPTTPERVRRVVRRHPVATGVAAAALALLVAVAVAAVSVARVQERELRAEVLKANAYAARALSGAVAFELRELADELSRAARAPATWAALRRPTNTAALEAWHAQPLPRRFDSVMLLDVDGRWLARSPRPNRSFGGQDFCWREYCAAAVRLGRAGKTGVHVARSYTSLADGTSRFSLSTPVYDAEGRWLGVLQGAVDSAGALGALALIDPGERHRMATLVARRDRERPGDPLPDDWIVLLHDGVARGTLYRMENRGPLAGLPVADEAPVATAPVAEDDDHRDPVPGFGGRWLAATSPVPGTPFAVIVQTRHEAAVAANARLASRLRAAGMAALGLALVTGAALFLRTRARRRM